MDITNLVHEMIMEFGENPERDGLVKTPQRVNEAYKYMLKGYFEDEKDILNGAIFESSSKQIVIVKQIEFYSLCEHHILPFFGTISIGYIPNGYVIGISKLCRLVDMYARRLQIQENLATDIINAVKRNINSEGVIVQIEATHMCMSMRGVEKQYSKTCSLIADGCFDNNHELQNLFLQQL